MNKTIILILISVLVILIGLYLLQGFLNESKLATKHVVKNDSNITRENCLADDCLVKDIEYPVTQLPEDISDTLTQALNDEYNAYATYKAVIETFGNVRPFIMIARAEQQHILSLQGLFEKYGIAIPENKSFNTTPKLGSLQEACALGVQSEKKNIALYKNSLLPKVKKYEDITIVFTNLMNASENKHLPAFQKCD